MHRRELAISSGELGRASAMLANTEEKQVLSRSLSNLGTLYENLGEIYCDLSDKDLYSFSELLGDQVKHHSQTYEIFFKFSETVIGIILRLML